ncbi:MAG: sulfite exporter TauE/SafE family protein [Gammaproteobacteria bacterium]|nr:sulfite exporter TauE/SafE family protein [Gammaproteobacteria bacterium]MCP4831187.1 sulfite exporter TauE/SafE family protein [Gammaproteobacteria bacterium]MCP4930115.1 sulfite exporter TauE/SafE family protein [Gammaproteobacteria bacterium]
MLAVCAVALGAIVQGVSGVGGGFIMVPLLAMINLSFLPGPLIFGSLSISGLMAWRERRHIDYHNTSIILAAIIPGAVIGAWSLAEIPPDSLGLMFGSVILFAVIISLCGVHFQLNRPNGIASGLLAGVMGASTGIGAPVIAVLYQRVAGPMVRSTLAFIYTIASLLIVCVLAVFGGFGIDEMQYGVMLVPGFMLGYLFSRPLALYFDHGATRYVVLGVSATAATSLIVSSL